ncbi:hypothetical protein BDP27DRAFT_1431702 [Rhodocollybia butyracea]|uniref:Uncharacterized protein n=1 Tax=Rhodocollybia butyracea TaxID=206335 RepID=A0A9P5PAE4_9AGAR|nr:hypothetical protein BDP27DRAFT_1431702 [Rhodocollybia butyracea]
MFPSFNGAFGDLLWEAYRLRCWSLTLTGIIPFTQDCFKFAPLIDTSLFYLTVDAAFLLSRAQRRWLVEFLNASKAISIILASGSEGWTHILPKLRVPSLTEITFLEKPAGTPSPIEILADFCNQHPNLRRIDCGPYQFRTSLTSKLGCQYPFPGCRCSEQVIEIQWPEFDDDLASMSSHSSTEIWHLFACLCYRSSIRELTLPANFPGLEKDVLSETKSSLTSRFPYLTRLQFREFDSLVEPSREHFLKWVFKVFPSLKTLELAYMGWDAEQTSCFARTVAKELPSIENFTLEYETRKVEEWTLVQLEEPPSPVKHNLREYKDG